MHWIVRIFDYSNITIMKIVLTGASGLIGSRFFDLLKSKYDIVPLSSSYGVDITDRKRVHDFLYRANPSVVVHMAAKTNVDVCESDRVQDVKQLMKFNILVDKVFHPENIDVTEFKASTSAFGVNVVGVKNLSDWTAENERKIIYISTDFVFDGEQSLPYTEEDPPLPIDWYGETKFMGERVLAGDNLITRISFPFGHKNAIKKDLIWTIANLLSTQEEISLVVDQIITPTFIDDIVYGLEFLIANNISGLYNLSGNNYMSPFDIGVAIAREFGLDESKITTTTRDKLYKDRAPRPFKIALKNDKLKNLGFEITDFFDALKRIR